MNRRQFVQTSALGSLAFTGLTRKGFGFDKKIKIGVIGCGWYGMVCLKAAFKAGGVECVALCDVDREHLSQSVKETKDLQGFEPGAFHNYQDLLDVKGLEAVIIATPPHWHALQFLDALQKDLDIYCEKPLAYDIREGQVMVDAAKKSDRIIQIGFQRRQSQTFQEVKAFVESNGIGRIVQTDVQIHYNAPRTMKDPTPQDPPDSLDWDAWCGPAPKLPYSPQIGHHNWRLEKAYGNGHLVDWGIHYIDAARFILSESMPFMIIAFGGLYHLKSHITTPDTMTANFEFETCPITWKHRLWGAVEYPQDSMNGIILYGTKASIFANDRQWIVVPKEKDKERIVHKTKGELAMLHMKEFLESVRIRKPLPLTVEDAYFSTATTQLGMIAYEMKESIYWNGENFQINKNEKANTLLKRDYRNPYSHPFKN